MACLAPYLRAPRALPAMAALRAVPALGRASELSPASVAFQARQKQTISRGIQQMLDEANAQIKTVSTEEAVKIHAQNDPNIVFVDIRDPRELERDGKVPGAFPCTRGMLEFWIDPESPYGKPIFQEDKQFIFYCAGGLRSALATKLAQDMGLKPVAHIEGGFGAWKKAGGPVEAVTKKEKKH
ncbi:Rhodanese-like domain-containing protein [Hyaloraphidium curvatum]|nr:Rhodanese-like domain-containing protein [Hyaloraphidium curvatum]